MAGVDVLKPFDQTPAPQLSPKSARLNNQRLILKNKHQGVGGQTWQHPGFQVEGSQGAQQAARQAPPPHV